MVTKRSRRRDIQGSSRKVKAACMGEEVGHSWKAPSRFGVFCEGPNQTVQVSLWSLLPALNSKPV